MLNLICLISIVFLSHPFPTRFHSEAEKQIKAATYVSGPYIIQCIPIYIYALVFDLAGPGAVQPLVLR